MVTQLILPLQKNNRWLRSSINSMLVALMITVLLLSTDNSHANSISVEHGAVSSRSILASQVGVGIMQAGGNAIDAAVAVGFALAVTYPSAGNLGGGGFMVIRLVNGEAITLDFRETAPSHAHRDMFLDDKQQVVKGLSTASHKASGVPGSVDGLLKALEKYGSKSRQEVLAPAIDFAEKGFPLPEDLARHFKRLQSRMQPYPASVAKFSHNGRPYQAGEIWRQPLLASTLRRISSKGRDGFYRGKTAALIVAEMQKGRGHISLKDLANYQSKWRKPTRGTYRQFNIIGMAPPSSGGALLIQMLNMLEPFDIAKMGWGSAALTHLIVEAERRAFADRAEFLGDADFVTVPMQMLTSKVYAKQRFKDFKVDLASNSTLIGAGHWPKESPETTHYSIVDTVGNAVATTTTLNSSYGSKIVVQGAGFLLNNEMDDFSIKKNTPNAYGLLGRAANAIEPGKRMLSSMTPTIVSKDGKLLLVTGSPGGSSIITTVLQVVINVLDHHMSIEDAVSKPRFHHQWQPNRIYYESGVCSDLVLTKLQAMGHQQLRAAPWRLGDANSVLIQQGKRFAVSDPRNLGGAVGF